MKAMNAGRKNADVGAATRNLGQMARNRSTLTIATTIAHAPIA
jgi:hypothetical protein